QRFLASVRAAHKVRVAGSLARERFDDGLRVIGRHLNGPVSIVEQDIPVPDESWSSTRRTGSSVIGCGSSIAARDAGGDGGILNRTSEAAVADLLVLAIPASIGRYPNFEMDVRLRTWLDRSGYPANTGRDRDARDGLPGCVGLGKCDCRVWQGQAGQACARFSRGGRGRKRGTGEKNHRKTQSSSSWLHGQFPPWGFMRSLGVGGEAHAPRNENAP